MKKISEGVYKPETLEELNKFFEKGFAIKNLTDSEIEIEKERMEREFRETGNTSFSFEYSGSYDDPKPCCENCKKKESEQRKKDKEFAFEEDRAQAQQDEDDINRRNEEENPLE